MKQYFPKWSLLIYLAIFILQCFAYHYNRILPLRPRSVHHWRQADGLVIAQNYYEEDRGFFNPATNLISYSGSRDAVSEFPIIQYIVAQLWKVFGVHEWIYRLINIIFLLTGFMIFMKAVEKEIQNSAIPILLCTLFFASSTVAFYGSNFLPDIPALGCTLAASGMLLRYRQNANSAVFLGSILFFTLGALFKVSFAMVPLSFFIMWLVQQVSRQIKIFHKPLLEIIGFIFFVSIIFFWLRWVNFYNSSNGQVVFLTSIKPIWDTPEMAVIKESLRDIFSWSVYEFFTAPVWLFFLTVFFALILHFKRTDKPLLLLSIVLFLACIVYAVLFFQNFPGHDYYYLAFLPFIAFTIFSALSYLKINHPAVLNSTKLQLLFFVVIFLNVWVASVKMESRYFMERGNRKYSFLISRGQRDHANYNHWNHSVTMKSYETITPYLRSLGIKREDMVVCIEDPSPNISLYMANQVGWTSFGLNESDPDYISDKIKRGAKYLFLNREFLKEKEYAKPYISHKMGQYQNVEIFDLRPFKKD